MMETINRGTDLLMNLKLEDSNGVPFRVRNTSQFILKLYTDTIEECIERSFIDGVLDGIIEDERIDKVVINSSELELLPSGIIKYLYSIKSPNILFDDLYYDEIVEGQTNLYLK